MILRNLPPEIVGGVREALRPRMPYLYSGEGREETGRYSRYVPENPERNLKQSLFLGPFYSDFLEVMYGGAAGGGKSSALLIGAAQYVDVPGYSALLLRRTYRDLALPEALMDRASMWFQGQWGVRWISADRKYVFETEGRPASITFGHLDSESHKYRYQSAAFQYIGFDELSQFSETQYRYLFSRLRRPSTGPASQIPLRMRSATNPGGVGHEWVKGRFITPWQEAKLPENRGFVPAKLEDNPFVDFESYVESLGELDQVTQAQLLCGDWEVRDTGGQFDRKWILARGQLIDPHEVPQDNMVWVRFWDLAATRPKGGARGSRDPDWSSGGLLGHHIPTTHMYLADMVRRRDTPGKIEELVLQTAQLDGPGVKIRMEQEPGASGLHSIETYAKLLKQYDFRGRRPGGSKTERARPVSAAWFNGRFWVVRGSWNQQFFDEAEAFPFGGHDDMVDTLSGGYAVLTFGDDPEKGKKTPVVVPGVKAFGHASLGGRK